MQHGYESNGTASDEVEQCDVLWRQKIDAGLSPRRVQYVRAVLRTALQSAVKKGRIARNVASLSDSPKAERSEIVPLTVAETKRLIAAIKGHRFEVQFLFSLLLGFRRGEVLGLTWPNVDLEGRTVTVRRQLQRLKRKEIEGRFSMKDVLWLDEVNALVPLKTRKSQRMLDLPPLLIDKLKAHKSSQAAKQLAAGADWKNAHALVFTGDEGSPVTGQMMTHALRGSVLPLVDVDSPGGAR